MKLSYKLGLFVLGMVIMVWVIKVDSDRISHIGRLDSLENQIELLRNQVNQLGSLLLRNEKRK